MSNNTECEYCNQEIERGYGHTCDQSPLVSKAIEFSDERIAAIETKFKYECEYYREIFTDFLDALKALKAARSELALLQEKNVELETDNASLKSIAREYHLAKGGDAESADLFIELKMDHLHKDSNDE